MRTKHTYQLLPKNITNKPFTNLASAKCAWDRDLAGSFAASGLAFIWKMLRKSKESVEALCLLTRSWWLSSHRNDLVPFPTLRMLHWRRNWINWCRKKLLRKASDPRTFFGSSLMWCDHHFFQCDKQRDVWKSGSDFFFWPLISWERHAHQEINNCLLNSFGFSM